MRPNFALNLGHDGIALLHRGKTGWRMVGSTKLDDPDLARKLAMLRKTAVSLETGGMAVKVLIPDSQILYTEIDCPDMPDQDRRAEISQRLEGLTPYTPDELAFDWRPLRPGRVRLAVVARDTLGEAEAFAREHRFNPVAFAAAPTPENFPGEPFFGTAESAAELLAGTGPVEPDVEALDLERLLASEPEALTDPFAEPAEAPAPAEAAPETAEDAGDAAPAQADSTAVEPPPAEPIPEQDAAAPASDAGDPESPAPETAVAGAPDSALPDDADAKGAGEPTETDKADLAEAATDNAEELPAASHDAGAETPPEPVETQAPQPAAPKDDGSGSASAKGTGRVEPPELSRGAAAQADPRDAAAEPRPVPTFASRRAAGTPPPPRIEPRLSPPSGQPELVPSRVPLPERTATPVLVSSDKQGPARPAAMADSAASDGPGTPMGEATGQSEAGLALADAPPEPAPAEPSKSPVPIRAEAKVQGQVPPPSLRRVPPVPPGIKPVAGAPARRAPVINFGPKHAAKAAALAKAKAAAKPEPGPGSAPVPEPPGGKLPARDRDDLSVFGARKPLAARGRRSSPMAVVVMTLLLLAAMAGLALWSTFWSDGPAGTDAEVALVPPPESPVAPRADTLTESAAAEPPQPELPSPDPVLTAPEVAAADPVLPGDPAPAADLAGRPLDPAEDAPAQDGTKVAALPTDGTDASPMPGALDPSVSETLGPDGAAALEGGDAGLVDEEALADGEPDALLDAVPGGGAVSPDGAGTDMAELDGAEIDGAGTGETDLADAEDSGPETELAALTEPEVPDAGAPLDVAPVPETPALPQDPVTELVGTDDGAAERIAAQLLEELTPEVAERRYAATGIWVLPPEPLPEPGFDSVDDLYVAAIDTQIEGEDAVALPVPSRDARLLTQLPPPPAGTRFDFDERGLVRATPEGALNPDGVLIFQGQPAVTPAPRPGSAEAAAAAANPPATPETPGADAATPATDAAPAVPKIRPKPRPEDLTELNEKATLGGRTRVELAGLRPRQRPAVIEKLALASRVPDAAAVDAVAEAANAAVAQVALELAPGTKLAVQTSLLPKPKPGNIEKLAAAVVATPAPAPAKKAGGAKVQAAAAVMPKLPTKASVAKSATVPNAIKLSKINLIGIYGSSSSRRALVRLANGKYVKVQIGDRLDGGKVAAIGESELIYVKGNRQHKLKMPSKT
ncbi:hypothetical protein [Frigidibacter sp. ROC022]|uniref:hypothetical protein n=1 Tax=Frigidibacter sp. ROC022 TaxID=2971796 RepID=UPI00215A8080|nr:hypothetical protein [Frigidibacter sp. ROC022]MCR8723845.1 hypothetical protein [Frigidibacter sp. ROC022]